MVRCLFRLVFILSLAALAPLAASAETRVMVLPFEVNALQDLRYLQTEVPAIIEKNLSAEGAVIVDAPLQSVLTDSLQIREIGSNNAVDYVIWGSLTWIGQQFSIDARVLSPYEDAGVETFTVEGEGIETLSTKIGELSRELSITLFDLEPVTAIRVEGNERIESAAILSRISTKAGDTFIPQNISNEL